MASGEDHEVASLYELLRILLVSRVQDMIGGKPDAGIFKGRYPQMDIITYGPIEEDCHTRRERMDLESLRRCYGVLARLLALI